jgi:hypothetical protein
MRMHLTEWPIASTIWERRVLFCHFSFSHFFFLCLSSLCLWSAAKPSRLSPQINPHRRASHTRGTVSSCHFLSFPSSISLGFVGIDCLLLQSSYSLSFEMCTWENESRIQGNNLGKRSLMFSLNDLLLNHSAIFKLDLYTKCSFHS